jgi:hypothetical protein
VHWQSNDALGPCLVIKPSEVELAVLVLFVSALRNGWRKLIFKLTDPYRPELHYMRGPGPKYQAKNSTEALSTGPSRLKDH